MSAQNFQIRNEIFGDEIRQGGDRFWISGAELVPLGHLVQGSVVVRNRGLELVEMTELEEKSHVNQIQISQNISECFTGKSVENVFF